jgi:superoxide dismutase
MLCPRDFSHLFGHLRGITDRAMAAHLVLYRRAVERLNAIEAAYPMVEWAPEVAPAHSEDAITATLLTTQVGKLTLRATGTMQECLQMVDADLLCSGITFRPRWYFGTVGSDFWTVDRAISVNIPWCYATPALWRLANRTGYGYTPEEMVRTLRHEAAHAICYAFELWKRPDWKAMFGDSLLPYVDTFKPNPQSRDFVQYLIGARAFYAQKHTDEDFAETFATWLDRSSNWRQQYAEWPGALRKLNYVDQLMRAGALAGKAPNMYPGRTEPYQAISATVAQVLGLGTAAPAMRTAGGWSEHAELLRQEPKVAACVALHELHFGTLSRFAMPVPGVPVVPEPLAALARANWGSWESYLLDLRLCCAALDGGWALTVWDQQRGRLRNVAIDGDAGQVPGLTPLLALDTHEHAYAIDYGAAKHNGIAAQLENVNWVMVLGRLPATAPPGSCPVDSHPVAITEPSIVEPT